MGAAHPQGTTFVLTDIEGSTRRWEADPNQMAALLEAHDAAIEATVSSFEGELIKSRGEGDSTFAVFPSPVAAVESALNCQLILLGQLRLPVRMAIHTGRAERRWGEYYGPPVNRAARLRSLAAGGRVLLSSSTAADVRSSLPADCRLVDLGVHLLKDLDEPEHIYGLSHPQLPEVLAPRPAPTRAPLVGRLGELTTLREALADAQLHHTRVAVVVGDGGIGKTRLTEEVGREACARGGRLVWATARADTGAPPFALWADVLRRLHTDAASGLSPPGDLAPASPAGGFPTGDGRQIGLDSVVSTVRQAAAGGTLVVVLDDLHFADPSSLELLRLLGTEGDLGGVLLIALARPTPPGHPARQAVTDLARTPGAICIRLEELCGEDAARLVAAHSPGLDPETVGQVARHAGGNPLFLRECASARARHPDVTAMPDTVRVAIAERLARLDAEAVTVLEVAAVAGRAIAVDVVAAAAGIGAGAVLRALGAAESEGLVAQVGASVQSWSFAHDLRREAVVSNVGPAQRAAVHGRVGRAIERLRSADVASHAAEIATHLSEAGASDWADAIAYRDMAARTALKAGAFEQAAEHCRRALDLAERSTITPAARGRLLVTLARGLTANDIQGAGAAVVEAIAIGRATGDQDLVLAAVAEFPFDAGAVDARAVAELRAAVHQLGSGEVAVAARLHGLLAFHYFTTRQWADQQREADLAWRLSRDVADPTTRFLGSLARLLTIWGGSHAELRREVLEECTWAAEASGDPSTTLKGRYLRARPYVEAADRAGFETTVALVEEGAGAYIAPYSRWVALVMRTMQATIDGQFQRAGELLDRAWQVGQAAAGQVAAVARLHQRAMLAFQQCDLAEQVGPLEELAKAWAGHPVLVGWLALALAEGGETFRAEQLLAGLDEDGFEAIPPQLCFSLAPIAEATMAVGSPDMAMRVYHAVAPHAGNIFAGFGIASVCYGAADRYLGCLAAFAGDPERALAHHRDAARLHRRLGGRLFILHGQIDRAEALAAGGPAGRDQARSLAEAVAREAAGTRMFRVWRRAAALAGDVAAG